MRRPNSVRPARTRARALRADDLAASRAKLAARILAFALIGLGVLGAVRFAVGDDFPDYSDPRYADPRYEVNLSEIVPDPAKGYEILLNTPMADPVLKTADLDNLWKVWEPEEKAKAERVEPARLRQLTFERYGLIPRPGDSVENPGLPLGYAEDGKGGLVTNCFSCHGGKVAGKTIPGAPNSHHDIATLITDVAKLRALEAGEDPASIPDQIGEFDTPYNMLKGVSNATQFAFMLGAYRTPDMNLTEKPMQVRGLVHNDLIAPAWWHYRKKTKIYIDHFGSKTHRGLMQFTMSKGNTGEMIRSWEDEFVHIQAYIESVQAPKYPYAIDAKLAAEGEEIFVQSCAKCHGTYGEGGEYPNKVIPLDEIGTDPVRARAVPGLAKAAYNATWFSKYGTDPIDPRAHGYNAPPLDGVWASAPYFHNGAVPTLWHVMHPAERPTIWTRSENGYDTARVGHEIAEFDEVPETSSSAIARRYYDTRTTSHSKEGHLFPDELDEAEKTAVLEYLKTL